MFNIGDKVQLNKEADFLGYIVRIECDPIEESAVEWESKNWATYVVRVYYPLYKGGYADFYRSADEISLV